MAKALARTRPSVPWFAIMTKLLFAASSLDRAHHLRRDPAHLDHLLAAPATLLVPVWRDRVATRGGGALLAQGMEAQTVRARAGQTVFLGLTGAGTATFAVDVSATPESAPGIGPAWTDCQWVDLREAGASLPADDAALTATAKALLTWHRVTGFCGRCGAATQSREGGHMRQCLNPDCATPHYPRTDGAVIMCVTDGPRILLHRQPAWPAGMWSVLAGFVEPGETLEQAVAREVFEETAILVDDIAYAGSQPWPFPASLMVGFTARAIGGQLRPDPHELDDAQWFDRADILARFDDAHRGHDTGPFLARPGSIARVMIDAWLARTDG